jgi:hypothetical protein
MDMEKFVYLLKNHGPFQLFVIGILIVAAVLATKVGTVAYGATKYWLSLSQETWLVDDVKVDYIAPDYWESDESDQSLWLYPDRVNSPHIGEPFINLVIIDRDEIEGDTLGDALLNHKEEDIFANKTFTITERVDNTSFSGFPAANLVTLVEFPVSRKSFEHWSNREFAKLKPFLELHEHWLIDLGDGRLLSLLVSPADTRSSADVQLIIESMSISFDAP